MSATSSGDLNSYEALLNTTPEAGATSSLQINADEHTQDSVHSPSIKQEKPKLSNTTSMQLIGQDVPKNPDETIIQHDEPITKTELRAEPINAQPNTSQNSVLRSPSSVPQPSDLAPQNFASPNLKTLNGADLPDISKVSAYARLEFENFIFYVQTLQVVLGRKSEHDQSHSVDVHLGASKAISRKHAKIFYNFGTERFELSIQGKNGAFVDDIFVERGATVPLKNKSKIQIGQIVFRFVLPGVGGLDKSESPSKPINPSDAISLRSSLYVQGSESANDDQKSLNVSSSTDFIPVMKIENSELSSTKKKEPKKTKQPKPPKKVYTLEEIPEEYRTKPACSYSNLIATCLRSHGTPKGMSLAEIYKSIREIFPYYKYCPDGWQSSVRHNLSLNKAFRKVSKEGKGWLWGLDEEYCAEKERAKKKQAAAAAAKAKAAQLKMEQQQLQQQRLQQQRLEQQKQAQLTQQQRYGSNSTTGTNQTLQKQPQITLQSLTKPLQQQAAQLNFNNQQSVLKTPQQLPISSSNIQHFNNSNQNPLQLQNQNHQNFGTIQFNSQSQPNQQFQSVQPNSFEQSQQTQFSVGSQPTQSFPNSKVPLSNKVPSIQAQLAANRDAGLQSTKSSASPQSNLLNPDTKKALGHLQQQLVILSKDLRKLVDKPTISAILTQAIAMTIAQVTQAAKAKGIATDPWATLIETNPEQLTKILTVALNAAAYKVTNGRVKAPLSLSSSLSNTANNSRSSTPVPSTQSNNHLPEAQQLSDPVLRNVTPQQALTNSTTSDPQTHLKPRNSAGDQQVSKISQPYQQPSHRISTTLQDTPGQAQGFPDIPQNLKGASIGQQAAQDKKFEAVLTTTQGVTSEPFPQGTSTTSQPSDNDQQQKKIVAPISGDLQSTNSSNTSVPDQMSASENNKLNEQISDQDNVHKPENLAVDKISEENPQHLPFLNGNIKDEEFDKVLESLSRETTPVTDPKDTKPLDDEELNRLLSSDFGKPIELSANDSKKRNLESVEDPVSVDNNKLARVE